MTPWDRFVATTAAVAMLYFLAAIAHEVGRIADVLEAQTTTKD